MTRQEQLEQDVIDYFVDAIDANRDYMESNFSLEEFAEMHNLSIERSATVLQNMEDEDVMEEIVQGEYTNFDITDRNQFNDCYADMISDFLEDGGSEELGDDTVDVGEGTVPPHLLEKWNADKAEIGVPYIKTDNGWEKVTVTQETKRAIDYAVAVLQEKINQITSTEDSDNRWAQIKVEELQNAIELLMNQE